MKQHDPNLDDLQEILDELVEDGHVLIKKNEDRNEYFLTPSILKQLQFKTLSKKAAG